MSAAPSTATPLSPSGSALSAHFTIGLAPADLVHTVVTVSLA